MCAQMHIFAHIQTLHDGKQSKSRDPQPHRTTTLEQTATKATTVHTLSGSLL